MSSTVILMIIATVVTLMSIEGRTQNASVAGCPECEKAIAQHDRISFGFLKNSGGKKCTVSRKALLGALASSANINDGEVARDPSSVSTKGKAGQRATAPQSGSEFVTDEDIKFCQNPDLKPSPKVDPRTLPDDGSVWRVGTNRWSLAEEKRYSDWIVKNVDEGFFRKINLETDCADAPAVIRAVYSRIHNLPMSYTDGLSKVGHYTTAWAHEKTLANWTDSNWQQNAGKDQRFRKFLEQVTLVMGTETVPFNTYPIKLVDEHTKKLSEFFHPGTVLLEHNYHTRFVSRIDDNEFNPIQEMSSTTPKSVRDLDSSSLNRVTTDYVDEGALNWRWTVNCGNQGWKIVSDKKMPGWSLQQFTLGVSHRNDLNAYLQSLVRKPGLVLDVAELHRQTESIKKYVGERVRLVLAAETATAEQKASPQWNDDMSTPHRDHKIFDRIDDLREVLMNKEIPTSVTVKQFTDALLSTTVDIGHGKKLSLYLIYEYIKLGEPSDPTGSFEDRWNLAYMKDEYEKLRAQAAQFKQLDDAATAAKANNPDASVPEHPKMEETDRISLEQLAQVFQ